MSEVDANSTPAEETNQVNCLNCAFYTPSAKPDIRYNVHVTTGRVENVTTLGLVEVGGRHSLNFGGPKPTFFGQDACFWGHFG